MRVHFFAAIAVLLAALFLKVTPVELALLALSILAVLCAEMVNTSVEAVVDIISPDYHPLAKIAKDKRMPRTFLLDATGRVLWFDVEYSRPSRRDLIQSIRVALGEL